jgi:hypothetical protein
VSNSSASARLSGDRLPSAPKFVALRIVFLGTLGNFPFVTKITELYMKSRLFGPVNRGRWIGHEEGGQLGNFFLRTGPPDRDSNERSQRDFCGSPGAMILRPGDWQER